MAACADIHRSPTRRRKIHCIFYYFIFQKSKGRPFSMRLHGAERVDAHPPATKVTQHFAKQKKATGHAYRGPIHRLLRSARAHLRNDFTAAPHQRVGQDVEGAARFFHTRRYQEARIRYTRSLRISSFFRCIGGVFSSLGPMLKAVTGTVSLLQDSAFKLKNSILINFSLFSILLEKIAFNYHPLLFTGDTL